MIFPNEYNQVCVYDEVVTIFIGADHRGFGLKERLKQWLIDQRMAVVDCGNVRLDPGDDFPVFAQAVAEQVVTDDDHRGILICGSGAGVVIAANKVPGVRCSVGINLSDIYHARAHDDLNILALASNFVTFDEAKQQVAMFLDTQFEAIERHIRRLKRIEAIEQTYSKK